MKSKSIQKDFARLTEHQLYNTIVTLGTAAAKLEEARKLLTSFTNDIDRELTGDHNTIAVKARKFQHHLSWMTTNITGLLADAQEQVTALAVAEARYNLTAKPSKVQIEEWEAERRLHLENSKTPNGKLGQTVRHRRHQAAAEELASKIQAAREK